ncbi:MAG: restriction endonuclease subunit S [Faecalibacterium prausnitzii]
MSKLDKLLRELCPNGVEYKKLGEIATISRGGNFQKKDFLTEGVPCIHYGQIYTKYGLFTDKTFTFISEECAKKQKMAQPNDIVMAVTSENIEDVCKCLAWLGDEPAAISGHSAIIHHNQNAKYLVYYFHSQMFFAQKRKLAHGTKVIEVTPDALVDITLPLPPIEVQREIVRMLDSYTESVVELQRQLTAELTARKAQYSHYRDKLLSYTSTAQMEKLGDTCEMKAGKAIASGLISDERTEETPIKCYGGNGVRGYVKNANENGSYPIIGRQGALCGNVKYAEGQFYATEHAVVVKPKEKYNPRFLYHLLTNMNLNQYKSAGAQPGLAVKNIAELVAPVPPLNVQNRIVNVLDNFEKICSDLNIGLPAEIEARQKQYEYYRDKLLTFAENGNTILSRAEQSRAEQSRAEQSRAEQSRAEQSRAEQSTD